MEEIYDNELENTLHFFDASSMVYGDSVTDAVPKLLLFDEEGACREKDIVKKLKGGNQAYQTFRCLEKTKAFLLEFPYQEDEGAVVITDSWLNNVGSEFWEHLSISDWDKAPLILLSNQASLSNVPAHLLKKIDIVLPYTFEAKSFNTQLSFVRKYKNSLNYADFNDKNDKKLPKGHWVKRIFGTLVASTVLLVLSPLMLLIAGIIKLESRGPIIYKSKRAGTAYKVFEFYKFRSMCDGADKQLNQLIHLNQYDDQGDDTGSFVKLQNDPRVTRFGKFLRRTSLDELPQLFNIVKGEMSIVGNRPLPLYEAATLTCEKSAERFMAPAGLTGLWQIIKRGKADMSVEERVELDIQYAQKHSLAMDFWIVLRTLPAMIQEESV